MMISSAFVATFALVLFSLFTVHAASLQQITDPNIKNPTNVGFYIYVPDKLATKPAIVVAMHYCTGTAEAYYNGSPYASLADQKGFIVIYPSSPNSGTCWDVSSNATLSHNGGGDSNAIANFVTWTLNKYSADATKVFATGTSSGAMMTNVMAAAYPEMFAAGIAYSGVAAGCFASQWNGVAAWNGTCATGHAQAEPAQWANIVRDMYKDYAGQYPRMQIYHGSVDTSIDPNNYNETVKQWAGVFGYPYPAANITKNKPQNDYETDDFGPRLQGIYATGVGHTVPIHGSDDMAFFGLVSLIPVEP